ncbi:MAG: DEAD/DEAH box helicase [Candidatus Eremiobacteraeota bacterium]|nr:DEAD/DEAH box helicase [Candidatus Eremiobacteraeota bacterium]
MQKEQSSLSLFHPLVACWFSERIGTPTEVQAAAWPQIASGSHLLITAPTGSGKTLTAFLWALDRLATGKSSGGFTSVLYVSPLKALNNDIRRNLMTPLGELRDLFEKEGEPFPGIRVLTRSGDTPQEERRRLQRHPPELLITTPESLNLMLSSAGGRTVLGSLSTVILDEIHALFATRRGAYLMTAVERLVRLSGEFQRIALSATIRPADKVAAFIGGYSLSMDGAEPRYEARPVTIISSGMRKKYDLSVHFPEKAALDRDRENFWQPFADAFRERIARNRSTLLFTNSRRLAEKMTLAINCEGSLAYAHHGSLSREIREVVEQKLKAGDLKAIVATSSLEMGIDIGSLDEVILIQSPFSISSAVQRLGRAGHQVGEVSRGRLVPVNSHDFVSAAVLTRAVMEHDIESLAPVECPLDVLAQILISMTAMEPWDIDELFAQIRTCFSYRRLGREVFNSVLEMLAGRYQKSRIRELAPRVSIDRLDNTVTAREGAIKVVYRCGGVIPDRGYFHMRQSDTGALLGELDEEFVWENPEGSIFTLGTQSWKVERITHNDVFVQPSKVSGPLPPFWKGEHYGRDFHFSARIGEFLEEAEARLKRGSLAEFSDELKKNHFMDDCAARELIAFLMRQREATGRDLPHRHHILIEQVNSGPDRPPVSQIVLHTLWGGRVNRPYALALQAAWIEQFAYKPEVHASDDSVIIISTHEVSGDEILALVSGGTLLPLLRRQLESSGFFCARFRESARRALLITPFRMNQRMPLWLSRLRSQTLLNAVRHFDDFPVMLETWRSCINDEFDMESLSKVLAELEAGVIGWTEVTMAHGSPFAQAVTWEQINIYMYREDLPAPGGPSGLREDLIKSVVFSPGFRPAVPAEIVSLYERKRQRLFPGYSPATPRDLLEWVKERLLIPEDEWNALQDAVKRDHGISPSDITVAVARKLAKVCLRGAHQPLIAAREELPRIMETLYKEGSPATIKPYDEEGSFPDIEAAVPGYKPAGAGSSEGISSAVLGEWLQFYGPRPSAFIGSSLGTGNPEPMLGELADEQKIITGRLIAGDDRELVCESGNFEALLRMSRAAAVPVFEPLGLEMLPLFLAHYHGLTMPRNDIDGLYNALEQLTWYPLSAALWESEIFPARFPLYSPSWLDTLMAEGEVRWIGTKPEHIAFSFQGDTDLAGSRGEAGEGRELSARGKGAPGFESLLPDNERRADFPSLVRISGYDPETLAARLWDAVWKGQVTNDTFIALRRGIETGFRYPGPPEASHDEGRRGRGHRRRGMGAAKERKAAGRSAGNWYRLGREGLPGDLLDLEEQHKERVRLLLDRYGILFRELLAKELPAFRWPALFRTLRLMELSGEVLAGCFFNGIPGPQFMAPHAFRMLKRELPGRALYSVNAMDPVSICGLQLDALKGRLPKRLPGTHCVYRGTELALVSERNGASLTFKVKPDNPDLEELLSPLRRLMTRSFQPLHRIVVETINGLDATGSPYLDAFQAYFDVERDFRTLILYGKRQ